MRELITSLMRFSGAVTMFGIEQVQSALGAPTDSRAAIARLCGTLDSMADSLVAKMDDSKKAAYSSMAAAQNEVVGRTFGVVNMAAPGELMQRTSQSLSSLVKRPNGGVSTAA
jgi:hypothetical protein